MTMTVVLMIGLVLGTVQTKKEISAQVQSTKPAPDADKPTTRPVTATKPTEVDYGDLAERVPIVRNMRFNHAAPTTAQIRSILRTAVPQCPESQRVWFIHVRANWRAEEGRRAVATVYFTPHKRTGRVRAGYFTYAASQPPAWQATLLRALEDHRDHADKQTPVRSSRTYSYWQVSRSDQPFGDELAVPNESLLPFRVPDGFTEEEVIEIVDFVRSNPAESAEPGRITFPRKLDGSRPIRSISRHNGVIEVFTGVQQDMCAGHGEFLRCRKRDDGTFEVLALGVWYS